MNEPIILSFNGHAPKVDKKAWVAPGAVLHGCTLQPGCLVGIGARVLDRAVVGRQSLVGAGSVVREGTTIPDGELRAGALAVKKRNLSDEEKRGLIENAARYVDLGRKCTGRW